MVLEKVFPHVQLFICEVWNFNIKFHSESSFFTKSFSEKIYLCFFCCDIASFNCNLLSTQMSESLDAWKTPGNTGWFHIWTQQILSCWLCYSTVYSVRLWSHIVCRKGRRRDGLEAFDLVPDGIELLEIVFEHFVLCSFDGELISGDGDLINFKILFLPY